MKDPLSARDLRMVLDVGGTLAQADGLAAFRDAVLEAAPRLVAGDVYGYNEVPPPAAPPLVHMSYYPDKGDVWWEALALIAEHPLVVHFRNTGDTQARAISDLVSARAYEGTQLYRDVLSRVSGRDQLAVSVPGDDGLVVGLAVNRDRRGFCRRDRAVYEALRPFLLHGYRNALARDDAAAITAALGAAAEAADQAIILVGEHNRVEHLTPGVAKLLEDVAPAAGDRLGAPFSAWLHEQRRRKVPTSLRVNGCSARLVRGAVEGLDTILLSPTDPGLTPTALRAIGLTPRESDVLALVAIGMTNAAVAARLGIAEVTVAKHLEHVFQKLGASSRTAAVALARTLLADPANT